MSVAVAVWSCIVEPGEPTVISPPSDLRITNIALGEHIAAESRTTLKLMYRAPTSPEEDEEEEEEDEEDDAQIETVVLCSLTPGKIEQATIDLVLEEDQEYLFEIVGKNTLHLSGNYIDQRPADMPPYDDESDEDEDAYHLDDVSSDVEMPADELDLSDDDADRFEEVKEDEPPKKDASKKRPRDSDAAEAEAATEKAERKKLNKKLKAGNGEAVAPEKPAEKKEEKKEKKGKAEKKEGEKKEEKKETKTLEGGLKITDHKVGTGAQAKKGDRVQMRYVGKLQNGNVFDKNTKGKPFSFRLGSGEVIKGWDVGIVGMAVGGERLLTIPPALAYGKQKQQGIPANSTLVFEVKLVGIN